jgi:O-antigen ligase
MGLLPFLPPFRVALAFFPSTPGDTHGLETVPLIDGLALCLFRPAKPGDGAVPYRFALCLYFLVVIVSITEARWPLLVVGYAWTLCRMLLLLLATWRAGRDDGRVVGALLRGMLLGVVYNGGLAAWQHFGEGLLRAQGSFSGWNSLGMALNLVVMVPVARILAGRTSLLTKLALAAAVLGALCSVSRGALLFLGIGVALVWLGSAMQEFTSRKAWFGLCGLLLAAIAIPIALSKVGSRAEEERQESMMERQLLENAASMMLREHPLGVGASHYTPELLLGGYGRRVGLGWREWVAIVHNVYWLTAAELGYLGVVALLALFLAPLRIALRRRPPGPRGDVLLGLGVGLLVFSVHSCFEWVWRLSEISYLYFMTIALVAVVARPARQALAGPSRERVATPPWRAAARATASLA